MLNIVLVEPEIPFNTGNIARTCAAANARLHLVKPLGFDISERAVKRAGLDYWSFVNITVYDDIYDFLNCHGDDSLWLATTKGARDYCDIQFTDECYILFGRETAGLPEWLRNRYSERCIRIPMVEGARCLNLSNSAAVICYEAMRQLNFPNLK